ncbi:DUF1349 domain-containing protein [Alicyclobacillus acidiphilus]|uniref:DUF1349 domain-containing protein n=1 Tax=Alicyclobacillus acidiphilus TaxID=182455 RepID=UPI0012EE331E|nr:DUF1349 domain-containing protein [Alicyclobacillus acidiphilus]
MNLFDTLAAPSLEWRNEPGEWRFYSDRSLFLCAPGPQPEAASTDAAFVAPYLFARIDGDFQATTQLRLDAKQPGDAGFLMIAASDTSWAKFAIVRDEDACSTVSTVSRDGDLDICHAQTVAVKDPVLRIERRGTLVTFALSVKANEWKHIRHFGFFAPPSLQVGIGAESAPGGTCEATFEYLAVDSR